MIALSNKMSRFIYTICILSAYLFMCWIPLFIINPDMINGNFAHKGIMTSFNLMTGGSVQRLSILGLGLTPSVIIQMAVKLLKSCFESFKESDKDPVKRQQVLRITRWLTLIAATGFAFNLVFSNFQSYTNLIHISTFSAKILAAIHLVFGSIITMWFTEQINHSGIGNGFGAVLLVSIMSSGVSSLYAYLKSVDLAQEWLGLVQVVGILCIFNFALLTLTYLIFYNRRKIYYLFIPAVGAGSVFLYLYINDHGFPMTIPMETMLSIGYIFSFFTIIILCCEGVKYVNKIAIPRNEYDEETPPDNFTMKLNPGGITPVIAAENSTTFLEWGLRLLSYTGILELLNFELDDFRARLLRIIWKSVFMFLISFWWTEIEFDPEQTAAMMKSRAIFPGVAEGKYTRLYISRFITMLSLTGAIYLLVVVTLPHLINMFLFEKEIYTNFLFDGTSVILLVACANELCVRMMASPHLPRFALFTKKDVSQ